MFLLTYTISFFAYRRYLYGANHRCFAPNMYTLHACKISVISQRHKTSEVEVPVAVTSSTVTVYGASTKIGSLSFISSTYTLTDK